MKTLRSKFLVTLIATLFLCLSLAIAFAFNTQKVSADVDNDRFAMAEGAQIALNKDGIRFRVQMGQNVYDQIFTNDAEDNVKLSVLIAPKYLFEDLEASANAGEYQLLSKKIEIDIDDANKVYKQGDYYYANAVLTNLAMANNNKITKNQFDYDFVGVGCIATTDGETTSYKYASFFDGDMANNVRSQYELAQAAVLVEDDVDLAIASDVLNAEGPYASWIGSENYPIKVDSADEYSILQSKVVAGLATQANFNVYNKFDLGERENLPENTTFFHYVNFYEDDKTTLIEQLEVKEGQEAVATKTPAKVGEQIPDYANSVVYEYNLSAWKPLDDSTMVANISNITSNKDVYAYYGKARVDQTLYAEACAANPDVALFFSENFGFTQLSSSGNGHTFYHANREYHPDMSYGGIQGMTSYTVYNTSGVDARMIFKIKINENFTYNAGDYVKFYVYSDITTSTTTARTLVRCNNTNGIATVCDNYDWSEIVFPAADFVAKDSNGYTYLSFGAFGTGLTTSDVYKYYISNVVRVPGSEVYRMDNCSSCTHTNATLDSTETWTVGDGDVEFVGPIHRFKYTKDHSYIGEVDKHVYCINGRLVYGNMTAADSGFTARAIGFNFANKISGKIYVTAKGFGTNGTPGVRYFTDGQESGTNLWLTFARVSPYDANGFAVWEMDFGTTEVAYMRLCGYTEYFGQVIISNISTTNPAA